MQRDGREIPGARRVRALALLGALTLEATILGLLLTAAPALTRPGEAAPVPAEVICESMGPVAERAV